MENSNVRVVKKNDVQSLARVIRNYETSGDTDWFQIKHKISADISKQVYGTTLKMWDIENLFTALCGCYSLCDASDDLIIQILELIGVHVEDDKEENEK